jgi:hypothetical protein
MMVTSLSAIKAIVSSLTMGETKVTIACGLDLNRKVSFSRATNPPPTIKMRIFSGLMKMG